jgi:cell fate regulator YaaT (PSP1 superfamily)
LQIQRKNMADKKKPKSGVMNVQNAPGNNGALNIKHKGHKNKKQKLNKKNRKKKKNEKKLAVANKVKSTVKSAADEIELRVGQDEILPDEMLINEAAQANDKRNGSYNSQTDSQNSALNINQSDSYKNGNRKKRNRRHEKKNGKKNGHSHGKNNDGNSELSDDNTMAKVYEYETYDTANALEVSFNTIKTSSTIDQNRYKYIPDYWFEDEPSKAKEESNKVPPDEDAVQIVGVRFKETGKVYYFAPMDFVLKEGDHVIVETARGLEYGVVVLSNRYVPAQSLVAPLRPVIRIATEEDAQKNEQNIKREREAFDICCEKIAAHGLDMKLIDVEYTFDNSKLMFYFSAEGRVDFRELVKDLASVFRTRIELRQIGVRDEAKLLGGLGVCGRPLCCSTFLYDFAQVSIRMAKEQNLSLNSTKISGACGRLMCCLRYECETYEKEGRKTPRHNSIVQTKEGIGVVVESQPLSGLIKVSIGDGENAYIKVFHRDEVEVIESASIDEASESTSDSSESTSDSSEGTSDSSEGTSDSSEGTSDSELL